MPLKKASVAGGIDRDTLSGTGTLTSIPGDTAPVVIVADNPSRLGCSVWNDAAGTLLLLCSGSGKAGPDNFSVALNKNDYFECPFGYQGEVQGVWLTAGGFARVTEYT